MGKCCFYLLKLVCWRNVIVIKKEKKQFLQFPWQEMKRYTYVKSSSFVKELWIQYNHREFRFMETKAFLCHNGVKLCTYSCKMSRGEWNPSSFSLSGLPRTSSFYAHETENIKDFVEIIVSIIFNLLRYVHSLAFSLGLYFDVKFQREKKQSLKAFILICYACCSL